MRPRAPSRLLVQLECPVPGGTPLRCGRVSVFPGVYPLRPRAPSRPTPSVLFPGVHPCCGRVFVFPGVYPLRPRAPSRPTPSVLFPGVHPCAVDGSLCFLGYTLCVRVPLLVQLRVSCSRRYTLALWTGLCVSWGIPLRPRAPLSAATRRATQTLHHTLHPVRDPIPPPTAVRSRSLSPLRPAPAAGTGLFARC